MYHWKWYLNFCSSALRRNYDDNIYIYIYIHGRHWIPHQNTPSHSYCELDVIIHVVHQRRLSMNEDLTWLHFMKMSCMALRKHRMETRHWGACSVLYAVHRAGDGVLNLINVRQSDDWEPIFVALETSSSIYLSIISLNHPHLQLVTPLWSPIPLQPHRPHNHPHPITIHTP